MPADSLFHMSALLNCQREFSPKRLGEKVQSSSLTSMYQNIKNQYTKYLVYHNPEKLFHSTEKWKQPTLNQTAQATWLCMQ